MLRGRSSNVHIEATETIGREAIERSIEEMWKLLITKITFLRIRNITHYMGNSRGSHSGSYTMSVIRSILYLNISLSILVCWMEELPRFKP